MFGSAEQGAVVALLRERFPTLLLAYAFGSRAEGTSHSSSDLDLAILIDGRADPLALFEAAGALATLAGCDVDLVDLRTASTVMQYQILSRGTCLFGKAPEAGIFEAMVLSEKTELDEARAGLIGDIIREGRIHGR